MKPYEEASSYLLENLEAVVPFLFPNSKRNGDYFLIGDITGVPGKSMPITLAPADKRGIYKDFANGERGSRNLCKLWKIARGIPLDNHARFFQDLSSFAGRTFGDNGQVELSKGFDWPLALRNWSEADAKRLASHPKRQYQAETVQWLHAKEYLGLYSGHITFAMRDAGGKVVGVNRWIEPGGKWKFIKSPTLLVIGEPTATELHIHESINDLIAMIDRTGWHLDPAKLFFCTWGVPGAKLVKDRIPAQIEKVYVWEQRDQPDPKTGRKPNEKWQADVSRAAARPVHLVRIPESYKDLNEWTIAGATAEQIECVRDTARLYQPLKAPARKLDEEPCPQPEGFPIENERPCFRLHRTTQQIGSKSFEAGVYWHAVKEVGEHNISINELICAPLEILATTSSPEDCEYGRQLQFKSEKGVLKTVAIPSSALMGDGLEVLQRLAEEGLWVNYPYRKKLLAYIATTKPERSLNCTNSTGWYQATTFVLPSSIYGPDEVWFQSVGRIAAYARAGTLEGWRAGIADKAVGNRFLLFGISFSLAGPLLQILGLEGIAAHIYGDSSNGKTTVLYCSATSWGGTRFRHEWRTTANGIEGVAKAHTDTLLPLDEIGEVLPKDLSEIAYFLINGHGKTRANKFGEARERALFRVALFSTGEISVRAKLAEAGISAKVGQTLRILDIPVEGKHGVFDELHGEKSGGVFSEKIRSAAAKHYGHAGPMFIDHLINLDRSELVKRHEDILATFGSDLDAQTRRAARVFAAVALAGELSIEAGIVSWKKSSAEDTAIDLFYLWYNARVGSGIQGEQAEILRLVADFIDAHSSSRFSDINFSEHEYFDASIGKTVTSQEPKVINRAGYWETVGESRRFLFTAAGLQEATKGKDWPRVLRALGDAGALYEKGSDGKTSKNRRSPEGRQVRLYHVDPDKLAP